MITATLSLRFAMTTADLTDRTVRALLVGPASPAILAVEASLLRHGLRVERHEDLMAGWLSSWDIVFLDISNSSVMPGELVQTLMPRVEGAPMVVLVADERVNETIEAMRAGAADGLLLPADEAELLACLRRNVEEARWHSQPLAEPGPDTFLYGTSESTVATRNALTRAARRGVTAVLITGPVGVGKTRAARYYLAHFPRRTEPLRINCTANPSYPIEEALVEAWGRARGGSLCLEDIDRLPPDVQDTVADRLDQMEASPRNGTQPRVVATCREDPPPLTQRLMHRLAAAHVRMAPLAKRMVDVGPLTEHILAELGRRSGRIGLQLSPEAWRLVHTNSWDGNVRQLQSVLERALLETSSTVISPDHLDLDVTVDVQGPFKLPPNGVVLATVEKDFLVQALERSNGNRTRAGALLGINRDQVRYRIEKFGLNAGPEN